MSEVAQEGYREKQKKGKRELCGRPGAGMGMSEVTGPFQLSSYFSTSP